MCSDNGGDETETTGFRKVDLVQNILSLGCPLDTLVAFWESVIKESGPEFT